MKISEILIGVSVGGSVFVIGGLKLGDERASDPSVTGTPLTNVLEEKNIRMVVNSLHQSYEMRFFVRSTDPFSYKLKVESRGDINTLVQDLERVELEADKYLSSLSQNARGTSFNRKLKEKLKAIRDFLDNYPSDNSYFLADTPGKPCPNISGVYKKNDINEQEEFISIASRGCSIFQVSRNKRTQGPVIKLESSENCRGGQDYRLCFKGQAMASKQIEFLFVEHWDQQSCVTENWLRIDEKGGTLMSKVRQSCKGAEVTVYEEKFFKLTAAN